MERLVHMAKIRASSCIRDKHNTSNTPKTYEPKAHIHAGVVSRLYRAYSRKEEPALHAE